MSSSECTRKASTNPFFPKGKIKAQLLRNPDVGKVSKEAVSFVGMFDMEVHSTSLPFLLL
jgi:hypothetical protein